MKNRSSLVLMEQLVMILVVCLAAAVCLQAFAWADRTSRELEQRSQAMTLCQNAAQILKAEKDMETAADRLGALRQGDLWVAEAGQDLWLELEAGQSPCDNLGKAVIRVVSREKAVLFTIVTGWQEVTP